MKEEKFIFKYNGDLEYIDFDTLIISQLHFTEFIRELKNTLHPDGELKIKVKAHPPGSFPIELFLDFDFLKEGTFVLGLVGIGTLVQTINLIFELFKHLKSKKPDKIEEKNNITIINIDNRTFEIPSSIYKALQDNPKIRKELSKSFEKIEDDNEVEGVELLDKNMTTMVEVTKPEFGYFDKKSTEIILEEEIPKDKIVTLDDQVMSVFKVVFSEGFQWQFIYQNNRINVKIEDDKFILDVMKGNVSFSSGDTINCKINIKQAFNEIARMWENTSYSIEKVNKILHRKEQTLLFDNEKKEKTRKAS